MTRSLRSGSSQLEDQVAVVVVANELVLRRFGEPGDLTGVAGRDFQSPGIERAGRYRDGLHAGDTQVDLLRAAAVGDDGDVAACVAIGEGQRAPEEQRRVVVVGVLRYAETALLVSFPA